MKRKSYRKETDQDFLDIIGLYINYLGGGLVIAFLVLTWNWDLETVIPGLIELIRSIM